MSKTIIYQVLPRLYGNRNTTRKPNGTIEENGCGKLEDFTDKELKKIKGMGVKSPFACCQSRACVLEGRLARLCCAFAVIAGNF